MKFGGSLRRAVAGLTLVLMMLSLLASCAFPGGNTGDGGQGGNGAVNGDGGSTDGENSGNKPDDNENEDDKNKEDEPVAFEDRFDTLKGTLSDAAIEQIKRLYSLYDASVYEWLANLWDNDVGGFYYANSARDYEGFLPDIESTRQTLAIIRTSGMVDEYGSNQDEAFVSVFPKEFADKIVAFVKSCQDPEDGYFYHPQWGKGIGSSRKARDLDQAITLVELFGAEFDYPTALDRLEGGAPTASLTRSTVSAVSSVVTATDSSIPYYLQSEEGLIKYLDTFDFKSNSHDTGHVVASLSSQLKAAGLIDCAVDYFDRIQEEVYQEQIAAGEKPSGLWQREVNYTSLSGLYKIGGIYQEANRPMKYLDECVDSAIECVLQNVEPSVIIYVYNPWAGMRMAVRSMELAVKQGDRSYDLEATYQRIRDRLPELVEATVNKLLVFQKDSGGFSYNRDTAAPTTQGTPACLGLREGDVNATNIAVNSISGMLFSSAGLDRIQIWNSDDFNRFIEEMRGVSPVDKLALPSTTMDFEEYSEGDLPLSITADAPSCVMHDPDDYSNMAMYFYSPSGVGTKPLININSNENVTCAIFEADIKMTDATDGTTHQIKFRGNTGNLYMLILKMDNKTNTLTIGDSSNTASGITGPLSIPITADTWNRLRLEIYTTAESELAKEGFIVKIFINDEFMDYSTNYFGPTTTAPNASPNAGNITVIEIYGMANPQSGLWMDNIVYELAPGQVFAEEY